jgi:hypothetical protein
VIAGSLDSFDSTLLTNVDVILLEQHRSMLLKLRLTISISVFLTYSLDNLIKCDLIREACFRFYYPIFYLRSYSRTKHADITKEIFHHLQEIQSIKITLSFTTG